MNSYTPERYCHFCDAIHQMFDKPHMFEDEYKISSLSVYANVLISHYQKAKTIDFLQGI